MAVTAGGVVRWLQQQLFGQVTSLLALLPEPTSPAVPAQALCVDAQANTVLTSAEKPNATDAPEREGDDQPGESEAANASLRSTVESKEDGSADGHLEATAGASEGAPVLALLVGLVAATAGGLAVGGLVEAQARAAVEEAAGLEARVETVRNAADYAEGPATVRLTHVKMGALVDWPTEGVWSRLVLGHVEAEGLGEATEEWQLTMPIIMTLFASLVVGGYLVYRIGKLPPRPEYHFLRLLRATVLWGAMLGLAMVLLPQPATGPVGQALYTASPLLLAYAAAILFDYHYELYGSTVLQQLAKLLNALLSRTGDGKEGVAPALPRRRDFGLWQARKRRELCNPVYGLALVGVQQLDHAWRSLGPTALLRLAYVHSALALWAWLLHLARPSAGLVYLLLGVGLHSLALLVVLAQKIVTPKSRHPLWPFVMLLAAASLMLASSMWAGSDLHEPLLATGSVLLCFCFTYATLALLQPNLQACTFATVVTHMGQWLRTPAGSVGIFVHMVVYGGLYVFGVARGTYQLLPMAVIGLLAGAVMMPASLAWGLCFHLPVGLVLLLASVRLASLSDPWVVQLVRDHLPGAFVAQAELLLDVHSTSALAGLVYAAMAMAQLWALAWQLYICDQPRVLRAFTGLAYMGLFYTVGLCLLVVGQREEAQLVYVAESGCGVLALLLGLQPCLPYVVSRGGALASMRQAGALEHLQGVVRGDVEMDEIMDELQQSGITRLRREAQGVVQKKRRRKSKPLPDADQPQNEEDAALLVRNTHAMPLAPLLLLLAGLRLGLVLQANSMAYALAVGVSVTACMWTYLVTRWAVLAMGGFFAVVAAGLYGEARAMVLAGLGGVYLMAHVMVARYRLPPATFALLGACTMLLLVGLDVGGVEENAEPYWEWLQATAAVDAGLAVLGHT